MKLPSGKTVVITGATAGIGKALRELYEKAGNVVVNISRHAPESPSDYAADIAEEVTYLPSSSHLNIPDLFALSDCVIALLKEAVDAFLNSDVGKARNLAKKDDRIDELFLKVRSDVAHDIDSHALSPEEGIVAALISKYLERIADHGVNLGEWVDYALTGEHGLS